MPEAAVKAFSPEWAAAFKKELNASDIYRQQGKGWKWVVALVVEAEPDRNFPETRGIWLDLYEGEAREVTIVDQEKALTADFVISAPYSRWKQVATKELDATKGMMQGKLKLRGDLPTIVRYTRASQEMTECTTRIPVIFPDEE